MPYLVCRLLLEKNFFNDTATTEIYTLSLHDALPILIGISVQPVPVTAENGESALLVMEVTSGGPGEEAGIQKGDLIVAADGEALTKSTDLLRVRRRHEAGETLKLLVERDGKRFTADVVLRESDT